MKFYDSEIGQAIMQASAHGDYIARILKEGIDFMKIAIPPIDVQKRILKSYDKFDELEVELTSLKNELSMWY